MKMTAEGALGVLHEALGVAPKFTVMGFEVKLLKINQDGEVVWGYLDKPTCLQLVEAFQVIAKRLESR